MKKEKIQILLLEDDQDDVALIRHAFESSDPSPKVQLIHAKNLVDARAFLAKSTPDIIIVDHHLPDGSGLELLMDNRGKPRFPCIVMTAQRDERLAVEIMKAGASDYIIKSDASFRKLPQNCEQVLKEWHQQVKRDQMKEALRASEERFHVIFNHSAEAIFVICPENNQVLEVNPFACQMLGYARHELLAMPISEIHANQGDRVEVFIQSVISKGVAWSDAFTLRTKTGRDIPVEISASKIKLDGKECILSLKRDISARKRAEMNQRLSGLIFENAAEAIMVTDSKGKILSVNGAFSQITGYLPKEVLGENPRILQSGRQDKLFYQKMWEAIKTSGHWQGEIWNRKKDGTVYPELLSISSVKDDQGNIIQYTALFSDISKLKEDEGRLHDQAYYDPLTGLPNRRLLHEHLAQAIRQMKRNQKKVALLFLDLDHFKQVNDTLGHSAGDEILKMASERLLRSIRQSDTIARSGGDEFLLLLPGIEERREAATIARKIIKDLSKSFEISGQEVFLGVSIGITIIPDDGDDPQKLFKNSDMAMYKAKETGRNKFHFFSDKMERAVEAHVRLEWDLKRAMAGQEFMVYYQPLVDLRSLKTIGLEALVRWKHPQKGILSPGRFISVTEESDLINEVGQWVLRTACKHLKGWQDAYGFGGGIHVNVSTRQIMYGNFQKILADALSESRLSPAALTLEVTESLMIDPREDPISKLQALKEVGIQLAMDDFGTGYSSLSYLARYPIDILKIDQSFISNIASDQQKQPLVEAIIRMGQSMKMKVVAEGVETKEDSDYLVASGCDTAQGYYFSKPVPWKTYDAFLVEQADKKGLF